MEKQKESNHIARKEAVINMVIMIVGFTLIFGITVYAADNTYAKNIGDWVKNGALSLAEAIIAVIAVKQLLKRQFVQFLGFIALAAIVLVIVGGPEKLQSIGTTLYNVITGGSS